MTTSQIAVRLPDELLGAVDALVPGHHASRSEAVRRALELYLYRLACERDAEIYDDAPLTGAELALGSGPRPRVRLARRSVGFSRFRAQPSSA